MVFHYSSSCEKGNLSTLRMDETIKKDLRIISVIPIASGNYWKSRKFHLVRLFDSIDFLQIPFPLHVTQYSQYEKDKVQYSRQM
jgi:hypothetical protein